MFDALPDPEVDAAEDALLERFGYGAGGVGLSQRTLDDAEFYIRFWLVNQQKPALEEFAERGPAEAALVAQIRSERRARKLARRAEKEALAAR